MPNWNSKTCGNCGFVSLVEDLPVQHCDACGRDLCPHCFGGTGPGNGAICKECAMKRWPIKDKIARKCVGLGAPQ